MAYVKQEFVDNKTILTANMLKNIEEGIVDNDIHGRLLNNEAFTDGVYNVIFIKRNGVVAPILEPTTTTAKYYFYDAVESGIFSPNNMYKRTSLYSQGGQDGAIYKGLSFRGTGQGTVAIKQVATGTNVGSMTWDKFSLLKPHDNSMSINIEPSEETTNITTEWTLGKTYSAQTGTIGNGSRAISPKFELTKYPNIELTVSSCNFIVCCYDSKDAFLGQITPELNSLASGSGQWLNPNTIITEELILSINSNITTIALVAYNNETPSYSIKSKTEECHMYSNIYNSYASSTIDKHIGECCVYHVYLDETDSTWKNSLKQLIKIGFINNTELWSPASETRPYGNFVVDAENKYLYAFTMYTSKGKTYWYKFNLPKITDGEWNDTYGCYVCTLNVEDILSQWTTSHQNYVQGACVYKNIIYSTEGFNGATGTNVARMRLIDPNKKQEIAVFHFFSDDDPVEPEFIDFYGGICYYGSVQHMYTLNFL